MEWKVSRKSGSVRNEPERSKGVLDGGLSSCAVPTSYHMSRYFRKSMESMGGNGEGSGKVSGGMKARMKGMVKV